MDGQQYVAVAAKTSTKLKAIWDEVGYGPEERSRQLEGMVAAFAKLCQDKVRQEAGVRDQFISSISSTEKEINEIAASLGLEPPPPPEAEGLNLTERLAYFEINSEHLKSLRDTELVRFTHVTDNIVNAANLLGEELEHVWTDLSKDLTSRRFEELIKKEKGLESAIEHRTLTISELIAECQEKIEELRLEDLDEFDRKLQTSLAQDTKSIVSLSSSGSCIGITFEALTKVINRREELQHIHDTRKQKLEDMGTEILVLWDQLDTPVEEQDTFKASVAETGMGNDKINAGLKELEKLRRQKSDRIIELVEKERIRIHTLWDELGMQTQEGSEIFPEYNLQGAQLSEAVLDAHTAESQRLSSLLDAMRPMLERIEEREALCKERLDDLTMEKDPNRLKTRNPSLQKQLAQELEKEKRITKRLPKLTEHLRKSIIQWEESQGVPFEWRGTRYVDMIDTSEAEYAKAKEDLRLQKLEKKKAIATPKKNSIDTQSFGAGSGNLFPQDNKFGTGKTPIHRKGSGSSTGSFSHTSTSSTAKKPPMSTSISTSHASSISIGHEIPKPPPPPSKVTDSSHAMNKKLERKSHSFSQQHEDTKPSLHEEPASTPMKSSQIPKVPPKGFEISSTSTRTGKDLPKGSEVSSTSTTAVTRTGKESPPKGALSERNVNDSPPKDLSMSLGAGMERQSVGKSPTKGANIGGDMCMEGDENSPDGTPRQSVEPLHG